MQQHGPTDLSGPVRGTETWWRGMGAQPEETSEGPPEPVRTRKTRKRKQPGHDDGGNIRRELVDRVRGEIAAGTYDTQEKWEAALDRLLQRLEKD